MNKPQIKKMMKETCFGLSYCCSLKKICPSRDKVMEKIGLSKQDFIKLKKEFDERLFEVLK